MSIEAHASLRLVRVLGQPVAAMPHGNQHAAARQTMVKHYPAITWRRALVRKRLALAARFPHLGRPPTTSELGLDVDAVGDLIEETLGRQVDALGFIWPANAGRARRYVYAFDANSEIMTFAKVGLSSSDGRSFEREARALERLDGRWGTQARVPRLLGLSSAGDMPVLLQEPLPDACRPTSQSQRLAIAAHRERARRITPTQLRETSWWADFAADPLHAVFEHRVTELLGRADTVAVGFAHGDLSPANALRTPQILWLTDFEDSCETAPAFADLVGALLSATPRGLRVGPDRSIAELITAVVAAGGNELDAMLAVAYRLSAGNQDAWLLAQKWPSD